MSAGIEYKLWLDGKPVDSHFYTMIDTVTVEQGIDLATEARVNLELCMDDQGRWKGTEYAKPGQRLRIEVRNHTKTWVPLIDGEIAPLDMRVSGEPGQSMITLVAYDDTVLLNRDASYETFENMTDEQVVRELFKNRGFIECLEIEKDAFPAQPQDRPLKHMKRGTEMAMLRSITDPYDLHVYVVPGKVGKSIAYVKRLSTKRSSGLPVLFLAGPDRNIDAFSARNDVTRATRYYGQQINIDTVTKDDPISSMWTHNDKTIKQDEPKRDGDPVRLLGSLPAIDVEHLGSTLLPPFAAAFRDVKALVERWQQRASYTVTASGTVRSGCYSGVLRAYDVVGVSGVPERMCTNFIVREVTHTLSRSEYRQEFSLMTNATADVQKGSGQVPLSVF